LVPEQPQPPKSRAGTAIAILAIFVILLVVLFALTNISSFNNLIGNLLTPLNGNTTTSSNYNINVSSVHGQLQYCQPSNLGALQNYSLNLINSDRAAFNLSAVTLSPIVSAQQHACSMEQNNYFSHWDTQGYKPYMRYSILNGTGAVEENVAYESATSFFPAFSTTASVEQAIKTLEYDMMYNDTACCQNGHRENILSPFHNRVSLGIMYNSNNVYFVEDFENYYINLNSSMIFNATNSDVQLSGSTNQSLNPDSVEIFYDPTPTPLNATQLNTLYQRPYDPGTFIGGVIPCNGGILGNCERFQGGKTVRPDTWSISASSVNVVFSLSQFISEAGSGVYTIYLTAGTFANQNQTEQFTSISIFIQTTA
jgi:uncharacterized protein YkwD